MQKILILGVSGMLGHKLFFELSKDKSLDVYGTLRTFENIPVFNNEFVSKIRLGVDGDNFDTIIRALASIQPDIVINCIGLIKQIPLANDPLSAITVNAQLPHRLSLICKTAGARLIHFSTDCIFDGEKGMYREEDKATAYDLYGRTKFLGEISYSHCLTIRTSIIGHELKGFLSLVEWFLRQKKTKGYLHAIFSGLPTIEIATVLRKFILNDVTLHGVYHLAADPISKYDLLNIIEKYYQKGIEISPHEDFQIDRSLNASKFLHKTGYQPPTWDMLIKMMHEDYSMSSYYQGS